jgi:Rrf2 family protein
MVRISRAAEHALVAIKHMSLHPDDLVTARSLSREYDLPAGAIAKTLQRLAAAHIVESEKGAHGGYRLYAALDRLSFLDLTEAVDGPLRFAACEQNSEGTCSRGSKCTVSGPVHEIAARIADLLSATRVDDVLRVPSDAYGSRR